ncbi:ubiquinone biosynthesis protein [Nocardia tenerifensis]|uniref:Ubiquinone biosynthesis protein n=1 Tax=Nocardia tenerifensis TaxID=228006 RepID=A0A318KXE4_9NOCA|nr:AarF/UbiB family protein [Nocardia tenerifensis]PXX70604.1 ubiquinone biosynthesis protein [Nocardia tenerifensis]
MRARFALTLRAVRVTGTVVAVAVPAIPGGLVHRVRYGPSAGRRHLYHRLVELLMLLGPTFVKAGQVLGTRRDILPPALCDELSLLQDSVAPLDAAHTAVALAEAYGSEVDDVFASLDPRPVASGSVASVYRARLRSGQDVAVKLRRPGIEQTMSADLALIQGGAAFVARLPFFRGVPVEEVVANMAGAILGQLDFEREADNLRRLRKNLSEVPRVWVPKVYPEACRPRCIVMEFIPDLAVGTADECTPVARRRFAASGMAAMYQMLFVDGFVHCDMHPGNLYFTRGAQVVVLDAGFSVQLTDRLRRLFAEFFMNMAIGRGHHAAEIVVQSAARLAEDADLDGFMVRMADLVERSHGQPAREFSLIAFAMEMFDLMRRFGIHAAPELIFPLLSLLVIEGTIRDLDPDMDFQEAAKPQLMRGLFGTEGGRSTLG